MARGWESKAVEDQIAASEERKSAAKRTPTPDELERESRRQGLLLSRAKIAGDIERARDERHRAALQQALDYIDSQIDSAVKTYLLSLPERLVRSTLGLGAGAAREVGEVVLPDAVRNSQLYKNLVDATLRFVIEQVGGVEGVYGKGDDALPDKFLARRTAGNAVEILGIVAFRASPVWVLAALADVCGAGRQLIPEMADALKEQGLLEKDAQFTSVDQILDGLERTSSRLAAAINTPPLDVAGLRAEWEAIRSEARTIQPASLPIDRDDWRDVGAAEGGISAAESVGFRNLVDGGAVGDPLVSRERALVLCVCARRGGANGRDCRRCALLDHYNETLAEMRETGYAAFAARQFRPVRSCGGRSVFSRKANADRARAQKFRHVQGPADRSR